MKKTRLTIDVKYAFTHENEEVFEYIAAASFNNPRVSFRHFKKRYRRAVKEYVDTIPEYMLPRLATARLYVLCFKEIRPFEYSEWFYQNIPTMIRKALYRRLKRMSVSRATRQAARRLARPRVQEASLTDRIWEKVRQR